MLNDSSVLGRSGGNGGILHMAYAGSLRKGDANIGHIEDGCNDVFLRMGDAGSGCMRDGSENFLRVFRMDDEFEEVEDDFS